MIDHVTIRVPNLAEAERFYSLALELLDFDHHRSDSHDFIEWNDFSIAETTNERPSTKRLHIGIQADSPATVDTWWQAMTDAGYPDDGPPGPRPQYGPAYYGAFVTDPAKNSIEAVHNGPPRHNGVINHLWLRVSSLADSTRFYETIIQSVGYSAKRLAERTMIHGDGANFSLVEGRPTENVHLAFGAADQTEVQAFHDAGTRAGYTSLGAPDERPEYHPGYYGAYLADPNLNNIEAVFHNRSI